MITSPPLIDAQPGDPITSEGWNNMILALKTLFDHANSGLGTLSVAVRTKDEGTPLPFALVTVKPADAAAPVRTGHFAAADVQRFLVPDLLPGAYEMVVEASGYSAESRTFDMGAEGQEMAIPMTLVRPLSPVPNLFGSPLAVAIEVISAAGFQLTRVVDSHGRDVSPAALDDQMRAQAVIGQSPEAGTPMPANAPVQIGVSAPAEYATRVKVPDIRGLSLDQAKVALEAVGLKLGLSSTVTTK